MEDKHIHKFRRVMVANRGEIAIRVYRALNELGITTIGIYSKEDKYALFRSKADESYQLNPEKGPVDAYLDIPEIIRIAKARNVDAIHPGYGFLSENPEFVDACEKNGITFIGPSKDIMNAMGDKISSKQIAIEAKVPVIPGVDHAVKTAEEAKKIADMVGYPVMLKACAGGGGRGIRLIRSEEDLYACSFYDYLDAGAAVAVEWSENIADFLEEPYIRVEIENLGGDERKITVMGAKQL